MSKDEKLELLKHLFDDKNKKQRYDTEDFLDCVRSQKDWNVEVKNDYEYIGKCYIFELYDNAGDVIYEEDFYKDEHTSWEEEFKLKLQKERRETRRVHLKELIRIYNQSHLFN